jgi:very-short-patch-repair endonuclease
MYQRMQNASPAQRKEWARAANAAARGLTHSEASLRRAAQNKCKPRGEDERLLAEHLTHLGIAFEEQAAVGRYNLDFLVDGIAVEPHDGANPMTVSHQRRRTEHLLGTHGIATLWIAYRSLERFAGCLDEVITNLNEMRRQPPAQRQHRVLVCGLQRRATDIDFDKVPAVPSPVGFVCRRVE